jgi:adenylate kinase family enzyme
MSIPDDMGWDEEVPPFRQLLEDSRYLFRRCAREYARQHPELIHDSAEDFVGRMIELHRGLVLKVFVEMAQADRHVGAGEMKLARELFEHAWGRCLTDQQLKESLLHYSENTHLRWESLLRPFERFSTFVPHAGELQTLILQLAWRVAEAGDRRDPRVVKQFQWIRAQMSRILDRVPLAGMIPPAPAASTTATAVESKPDDSAIAPQPATRETQAVRLQTKPSQESLADVLADLDALIGMDSLKQDVRELVNFLMIQAERRKMELPLTPISLHAVFSGNPGTGKTTVARLVGRILGALGILTRGHLIESDRSSLVAEYAGQTAPKTHKRIDEALDGVLFIDEAYSLIAEKGDDPYGAEAVQTLLKRMEDDRDRLVVILAGYPRPMEQLLASNPGLSSRFSRTFVFPDYTARELGLIFQTMCDRDRYQLPAETRARLLRGFAYLLARRDAHFGNGRFARNVFERSIRRLATRLSGVSPLTRELLTTLRPEDIVVESISSSAWRDLESTFHVFELPCGQCGESIRLPGERLGQTVECRHCKRSLVADWGEPSA